MTKAESRHGRKNRQEERKGGKFGLGSSRSKAFPVMLPFALLLLFALLVSACQAIEPAAPAVASSEQEETQSSEAAPAPEEDTGQEEAFLDLESEALDMDAPMPLDPSIRKATLENGLTYYIRHNTEPANRATLMLVVNAGSVQEDDDQLGLAHFLEHMMFNGTERFPEQDLIAYFESVGMTFGPDVNAYTSFDETVYFLEFPTDDAEIISTTFEVAEDWASQATIGEEAVDGERGVILEEERLRMQNASGRLNEQIIQLLLGGSRYAERSPIGDMEIIETVPADALRRFYNDWYRPDLMAVIVVGDIDMDDIETKIVDHFSGMANPDSPRPRLAYTLPDHDDTQFLITTDPEFPVTLAQIFYRQTADDLNSARAFRDRLLGSLFYTMLNFRLDDITRQADYSNWRSLFTASKVSINGNYPSVAEFAMFVHRMTVLHSPYCIPHFSFPKLKQFQHVACREFSIVGRYEICVP